MQSYIKYIILLVSLLFLISSCDFKPREERDSINKERDEKRIRDSIENAKSSQYIMGESFTGNKTQIIDLIKGQVTFIITHEGTGTFKATLTTTDAKLIEVLYEGSSNIKEIKTIEVSETSAYLIDVKTEGKWSIIRK